jgi:hypothetical protein
MRDSVALREHSLKANASILLYISLDLVPNIIVSSHRNPPLTTACTSV